MLYELMALRHAFDAKSIFTNKYLAIEGLGIKILRGQYPMIPKHYSEELKSLVPKLLTVDP